MTALERYDKDNHAFDKLSAKNAEARTKKVVDKCKGVVLDIGCGYGYLADYMIDKVDVKEYYGIDYCEEAINKNKVIMEKYDKINFIQMDLTKDELFSKLTINPDVIICNEFIEHIYKPYQKKMLMQIKEKFDEQGYGVLIGTTPKQKEEGPNNKGNHYHVWEHTHDTLKKMLENIFDEKYDIELDVWFGNATYFEVRKKKGK